MCVRNIIIHITPTKTGDEIFDENSKSGRANPFNKYL